LTSSPDAPPLSRWQRLKRHLREVVREEATPHAIAIGFSVATFWAVLPTPGFSIAMGFLTALLVPHLSKVSMGAGFAIWNPLVTGPINAASIPLGAAVLGVAPAIVEEDIGLATKIIQIGAQMFVGSGIVAAILGVISYFLIRHFAARYQARRKVKLHAAHPPTGPESP
jgi:uncharacterized protein